MSIKKGIFYVFIANSINLLVSLFSGFIIPKYLSVDTYAYIKLFQLYISYIGIAHLGYSDGMYLRLGGKELETIDKKQILEEFKTFKVFQLTMSIIVIIIAIIIKNEMLLFCSIVIIPVNIANYIRNLYNAIGQFKKYSRFTNINTIVIFVINLILLFLIKTDYYYIYIMAYIVAYFIYGLYIEYETKKLFGNEKVNIEITYIIKNIKSGFLLLIGNFCNVIFTSIDRIFVKNLIGLTQFAYYSFSTSIESLMNVFITPISTVMYNYFCQEKDSKSIQKVKKIILLFSSLVIAVIFPTKFIVEIWLIKYKESLTVLFILFAAQYISIMIRAVHINLYKAEKKQNRYFKIMMLIVLLSVILNTIGYCVQKNMTSIAMATLITNIIWYIIGEMEFSKYKLQMKDYIYTFAVLILFLICGKFFNAVFGLLLYSSITFIFIVVLERDSFKQFINEGTKIIKLKMKKDKNSILN